MVVLTVDANECGVEGRPAIVVACEGVAAEHQAHFLSCESHALSLTSSWCSTTGCDQRHAGADGPRLEDAVVDKLDVGDNDGNGVTAGPVDRKERRPFVYGEQCSRT